MRRTRCGLLAGRLAGEHTAEALTDEGDGVAAGELADSLEHQRDRARDVGRDPAETELVGVVAEAAEEATEGEQRHVGRGEPGKEQDRPAQSAGQPPQAGGVHRQAEQLATGACLAGERLGDGRGAGLRWHGRGGTGAVPTPTVDACVPCSAAELCSTATVVAAAAADVVVEDGRIVEVGPGLDGDDAVDCTGRTILPGFIDSHVHFMSDGNLDPMSSVVTPFSLNFYLAAERMARTLAAGVTTVREAGGSDLGVKEAQASGLVAGPRMLISITILSQTGGHADRWQVCGAHLPGFLGIVHPGKPSSVVDGPEEMRRKVRELIRAGADVIKVCTSGGVLSPRDDPRHGHFRDDELDVLVAEATAAGKWVMSHAQATDGIKSAVRAGVRSIEHGIYLDDEAIEMMIERGTYLVPTLVRADGRAGGGRPRDQRPRVRDHQDEDGDGGPPRLDRACDRGGRQGRDGHGQRGDAARAEPARARADGELRDVRQRGAGGDDANRRRAAGRTRRSRHDRAGQAGRSGGGRRRPPRRRHHR